MRTRPARFFRLPLLQILASLGLVVAPARATDARVCTFKRGISVGHWLAKMHDGVPYGAPWFGRTDIAWIAQQGFDHIRYPVDGRLWLLADGSLDESKIAPFLQAVTWTRELGLGAVLDMHFLPGGAIHDPNAQDPAIFTDESARANAARFWAKVAERLAGEGAWLRFEIINEPFAPKNSQLNALNRAALAAIRAVDRDRVVYVTSNLSSTFATLADVVVPDDSHVAIVLHYDEPLIFTHQRAPWKHFPADMPLVPFPGQVPDLSKSLPPGHPSVTTSLTELTVADIDADFARASAWLRQHAPATEVYLGEFGCYEQAPVTSRRAYIAAVRAAAERAGWGWAVWDYRSSFAVRDADGKPTAVLDGLFPRQ